MLRPELLSPVGGWPQLRAAIESGADAVYFGLTELNARARAANFEVDELPRVMETLHERGLRGFVTLNTLVFDRELGLAADRIGAMSDAGVDAVIVQDVGAVKLIREVAPHLPVHASTQMTITSAEGCAWAASQGIERVVLARELSIREIAEISRQSPVEIEVFVHGALCVSYSGQCFSSEAWGGRSANRGQCAQACRLPYDMLVDGSPHDLGELRYLLSPQDLMAVEQIPALIDAGVACFKIEGRLKGPEYVAATTAAYRSAIDAAVAGQPVVLGRSERRELEQVFSRGLTPGFLEGTRHQRVVAGRFPRHRGVRVGTVVGRDDRGVVVRLEGPVKRGDGVVFDAGRAHEAERGGRVFEVFAEGRSSTGELESGEVTLTFANGVDIDGVGVGDWVWRNRDEALEARIRARFEQGVQRRDAVSARVSGRPGEPIRVEYRDARGRTGHAETSVPAQPATGRPLDADRLRAALERLGETPFELADLDVALEGEPFVPVSALNDARRRAVEALLRERRALDRPGVGRGRAVDEVLPGLLGRLREAAAVPVALARPGLSLMCRTPEQARAAISVDGLDEILLDFLEVKGLREAVDEVRASGRRVVAVTPRVLKPDEERIHRFFAGLGADALLVRSVGMLQNLSQLAPDRRPELHGDFSLNAANAISAEMFLAMGLSRLAPTHDLDAEQLIELAGRVDPLRLELIVHHHLPIFHTEHCVFARFLSNGESFRDCGHPCERHDLHLLDRDGRRHRVFADIGCRNTVFNAQAQSGADRIPEFLAAGYRRFRIELTDDAPGAIAGLVDRYRRLLDGHERAADVWRWLDRSTPQGITAGSLAVQTRAFSPRPTARRA